MAVTFYDDRCTGISSCNRASCIHICELDAIENINDKPYINEMVCTNCGLCVMNCPKGALSK
ncbi:MAG: ferredoxin [Methanosphaera stadtmanae]|nr:ferredoxin [Methanosphaera stadtmanae]